MSYPPRKASRWPKVVRELVEGPKTVSQLAEATGAQDSAVTRNLVLLEDEGLIREVKGGVKRSRGGPAAKLWEWVQ